MAGGYVGESIEQGLDVVCCWWLRARKRGWQKSSRGRHRADTAICSHRLLCVRRCQVIIFLFGFWDFPPRRVGWQQSISRNIKEKMLSDIGRSSSRVCWSIVRVNQQPGRQSPATQSPDKFHIWYALLLSTTVRRWETWGGCASHGRCRVAVRTQKKPSDVLGISTPSRGTVKSITLRSSRLIGDVVLLVGGPLPPSADGRNWAQLAIDNTKEDTLVLPYEKWNSAVKWRVTYIHIKIPSI